MSHVVITLADLETAVPLDRALEAAGLPVTLAASADEARAALLRKHPELLVLTGGLHEPIAHALVERARELEVSVLALFEPTDSDRSDRASRLGATATRTKPITTEELVETVQRLVARRDLQRRTGIAGDSAAIQEVLIKIEQMAPVSSTVLIEGESGTGKELVAKAIHDLSPRRGKPFIAINCAALPETLLESELFGHEKGAFTGAAERRLGRFELADTGTIFLDEIGEIPNSVQVKLLRVLETKSFFRVGGVAPIKVDVRVLAATNRALRDQVAAGEFRDDLYYRLNVLAIYLPPLRERPSDIPQLVRRFVREFAAQHDRPFPGIAADAMEQLIEAPWPGNVRQLRNLIESMVVLAPGTEIRAHDIPRDITERLGTRLPMRLPAPEHATVSALGGPEFEFILRSLMELRVQVEELRRRLERSGESVEVIDIDHDAALAIPGTAVTVSAIPPMGGVEDVIEPEPPPVVVWQDGMSMADVERTTIATVLEMQAGNRRRAAQILGIGERTLYRKLKEYDLG
ncbi:MAG: sigma-54 dependent transcriptional regulator [Gemmatimonadota bacterium]